ncbi:MAG: ferrochelatase, partial [Dolichospermum sp.]
MVVTPEKLHTTHSHEHLPTKDRVAVLLMGYGEVES